MNDYNLQDLTFDIRCIIKSLSEIQKLVFNSSLENKKFLNENLNTAIGELLIIYDSTFAEIEEEVLI